MRNFTFLALLFLLPVVVSAQRRARVVKAATDTIVQAPSPRTAKGTSVKEDKATPPPSEDASPRSARGKATTTPTEQETTPKITKAKATKPVVEKEVVAPKTTTVKTQTQPPKVEPVVKKTPPKSANAILPKTTTIYHKLGEENISIKVMHYGEQKEPFFINLHDDEITAVSGAKRILETDGGTLVRIDNNGERNIRFKLDKKTYAFDPNRIFSRNGIIQTLNMFGKADVKAIEELEKFAARILQIVPTNAGCIIALHNNSNGLFSIDSYFSGREREKDAKAVSARPNEDADDLFLTTDSSLFFKLRKEKFNIVWQDNANAFRDGSLSIYCGEKNICYLNCETEHGRLSQYWDMISTAYKYVRKPVTVASVTTPVSATGIFVYSYQLSPNRDSSFLSGVHDIYFGDKKIGTTRLTSEDGTSTTYGQLEVLKSFPLYDNMELYYFKSRTTHKIEVRVDPTRQKTPLNPDKAVLFVKVVS